MPLKANGMSTGTSVWEQVQLCEHRCSCVRAGTAALAQVQLRENRYNCARTGTAVREQVQLRENRYSCASTGTAAWARVHLCEHRYICVRTGTAVWEQVQLCEHRYNSTCSCLRQQRQASLHILGKRKISCPYWKSNPRLSNPQPCHYTNWTMHPMLRYVRR
jgi:hypothetical protein